MSATQPNAPSPSLSPEAGPGHLVRFYDDEGTLFERVADFLRPSLVGRTPALIIATEDHLRGILQALATQGVDHKSVADAGRLVWLDARTTLGRFMSGRAPDPARFAAVLGDAIDHVAPHGMPYIYSEMVDVLWREGQASAAVRVEELWDELARTRTFRLLRGCHVAGLGGPEEFSSFETTIERTAEPLPGADPAALREIDRLKQRTRVLEQELVARRAAEAALRHALRDLQHAAAIIESSEDAIIAKDLDGNITSWNRGAERLYGYTAEEMIGRSISLLIPEDHPNDFPLLMARLRDGERIEQHETVRVAKDGLRIDVALTISPVKDAGGRVIGASKIARDITPRKRAEAALRASEERLREADRRKDEFIAVLAHELRNPLAPVRNAVHLLGLERFEKPDVQRSVAMIEQHVTHMSRLIDDLLDVSRISQGRLELRRGRVEVHELVEAAIQGCRHEIDARQHALHVKLPDAALAFRADRARLIQVLCNLLTNAARYSLPGGDIVISASEPEHGQLQLSVRDQGAGIPREKLEEIFHLFAQLDRSLERQGGGLGIGLTLARQIVRLHGGTIEARSEGIGRGSEFIVTLPIRATEPAGPTALLPASPVPPRRILIADDNHDAADSLAMILERRGHQIFVAYDGALALDLAEVHRPDVLLLDLGMPKLDGYAVARGVRARPWGAKMLLVALTGWGQAQAERQAREAGFDTHIVKPATIAALDRLLAACPKTPARA